jgi:hypothetical protein
MRVLVCSGTESKEYVYHLLQTSKLYWNEVEDPEVIAKSFTYGM